MKDVKSELYDKYVSSGQAKVVVNAGQADYGSNSPYVKNLIRKHLPADLNSRILDLGCGNGLFLHFLKLAGYKNVAGADISQEQIDIAHSQGINEAECGDIFAFLDKQTTSPDYILLFDIIEHFNRDELFSLLNKISDVMHRGSKLIIHIPNGEGISGMRIRYGDLTHEFAFTTSSVRQLLMTTGFADINCFEERPVVHGFISLVRRIIWDIGTLPRRILMAAETGERSFILSQNMLVVASKK